MITTSPLSRLHSALPGLSGALRQVADYVLAHPEEVIRSSSMRLARAIGVSDASVIRFCQAAGFAGLQDLKMHLAKELATPMRFIHEEVEPDDPSPILLNKVMAANTVAIQSTLEMLDTATFDRAVEHLRQAQRIEVFAVGNSIPVALDLAYRFMRLGKQARFQHDASMQALAATLMQPGDAAVCISHSGRSRDILDALELARQAGANSIGITHDASSPLAAAVDCCLTTVSRETMFREEAMSSRIAQLALVDCLYVAVAMRQFSATVEGRTRTAQAFMGRKVVARSRRRNANPKDEGAKT